MKRYTVRITTVSAVQVLAADEQEAVGKAVKRLYGKQAEWEQDPSVDGHGHVTKLTKKGKVTNTGRARLEVIEGWPATPGLVPKTVEPMEPKAEREAFEGPIKRVATLPSRPKRTY